MTLLSVGVHSMQEQTNGLLERTIKRLMPAGRDSFLSNRDTTNERLALDPELSANDEQTVMKWIDSCLAESGGQVAARARAAILGRSYLSLSTHGRIRFLKLLTQRYTADERSVETTIAAWTDAKGEARAQAAVLLRHALEPPRMKLLAQFNAHSEGVKFLVDMRADLMELRREHPELKPLEADLKRLLSSWFDIGLLSLEQMDWNSTSAGLLEKLVAYEAVHAIQSWRDLKNRLDTDRRIFAFFHPNMPNEPLIFVEVALMNGMADNVQRLLDVNAPVENVCKADTAIFYSISNAQPGLAGISFGNYLIKRVVELLKAELPQLKRFATLSPIPGFRNWLETLSPEQLTELLVSETPVSLDELWGKAGEDMEQSPRGQGQEQDRLLRLAAHYLSNEKRNGQQASDSVANFHLSNGAQIARLNWMADTSGKGLKQSGGLMVNYLYELPKIEARSQGYTERGEVSISSVIRKNLK